MGSGASKKAQAKAEVTIQAVKESASKSTPAPAANEVQDAVEEAIQSPAASQVASGPESPCISASELPAKCRAGDVEAVKSYLEQLVGALPEQGLLDEYGDSCLHHATYGGHGEIVELLLQKVEVDMPNARNETPLLVACRKNEVPLAMQLLKAGAQPNRVTSDGLTPFLAAVLAGVKDEVLDALFLQKADVNVQDARGVGALHSLALSGNRRLLTWLMTHNADLDLQTEHGTTALMLASKRGAEEAVALLLEARASVNFSNKAGSTALMQAFANIEVARLLMDYGASVDMGDSAGRTALFHAVVSGDEAAVQLVIQRGGRVNILDEDARTPLYQACLMGSGSVVQLLLESFADPNLAGRGSSVRPQEDQEDGAAKVLLEEARTCLQVSMMLAQNDLALLLLEKRADMNSAPGSLGWSPLHLCAIVNNEEGAQQLLAHGAALQEDVEGNTARMLAERAGHNSLVQLLSQARSQLPPLSRSEPAAEWTEPLEAFKQTWQPRSPRSLLDRVFSPMVHDAMMSQQWRDRWQAHSYIAKYFSELEAEPEDLVRAVGEITCMAARDKMPKVFLAAMATLDELLSDARVDDITPDAFLQLLRSDQGDMITLLLDQTDQGGGSSNAKSPQQVAASSLCSCILHGRIPLDDAAWPLLARLDDRLDLISSEKQDNKLPKCLAANLKFLGRLITSFGLQQSGLFRRALLLPLLLRAAASEHSKVRAAAGDCLLQVVSLSGGIEERVWNFLPAKAQKRLQGLAAGYEGIALLSAVACDEDALSKEDIVAEDARAESFFCVSELSQQLWTALQAGEKKEMLPTSPKTEGSADDAAAEALKDAMASKNWKQRAESINKLFETLATANEGVKLLNEESDAGPLLSQYVLGGFRISILQSHLTKLLQDTVTAVFVSAADLLCLICSQVPLYIAPLFLEPLLPALFGRLLDTSQKVRHKASETAVEVSSLHGSALSEMVAQCVSSAWCASERSDRSTQPRLQLLNQMLQRMRDRDSSRVWSDETWGGLADYALKAAENKSSEVRQEATSLLQAMVDIEAASELAEQALQQLKLQAEERQKQKMRPGTGVRPLSSSCRPGTNGSRMGTASGRLSFNSSGRLSTANRSGRLGTAGVLSRSGTMTLEEESDNSLPDNMAMDEDGVKFFDVKNAAGGATEVPEVAEGEAVLKEALPLAEALDEVAMDFVAPLIALFGEGWTRCFYSRNWQCRVAALTHLSAIMAQRLEEVSDAPLAELLDGCMRAVHEGLGDQNVRVYAEACMAVTAIVPSFCGTVDGRLLVAHLAPLLRQLCARMGDSKEAVRTHTTQAMFRLLSPPTGNIISPVAIAMLILRHLVPAKEEGDSPLASVSKGAIGKGAVTGWLCRLSALRELCKEYAKMIVQQPGSTSPGEWLRLADGLKHADPSVRHQSVRLYTLVCKMHLKSLGDLEAQLPAREHWVAALQDVPGKSIAEVRRYLKLPEALPEAKSGSKTGELEMTIACAAWNVPSSLPSIVGCRPELLAVLSSPERGEEKMVIAALKALQKVKEKAPDETFGHICRAIQQALAAPTGADRQVFLCAVELCQQMVQQLGPSLSGLDLNMALGTVFPTLLERTALSSLSDVKVGVASDKLVQQLAKHPKVGCEAVTKMVIASITKSQQPIRQLVLLRTLLSDFGLRLCAQKDIVSILLHALGAQLESGASDVLRPQLVGVLATCKQFSNETVRFCLGQVDSNQRKLLCSAMAEAPDPQLLALGAADMEPSAVAVGSAVRAASRSRGLSPARTVSPQERAAERPLPRDASPRATRRRRRIDCSPQAPLPLSEASTAASDFPTESPRRFGGRTASTPNLQKSLEGSPRPWPRAKPPAPMSLSTALKGDASWKFRDSDT